MPQTSFALMTNLGRAKEAAAYANATTVEITHIAIGDGATVPSGGETALYNQVALKTISGSGTVVGADNVAYFDCFLTAAEGPYTIREAGLYDVDGDLIAIAHYDPPISKPVPASGQTVEGTVRLEVAFSNIANITISIDPTMQVVLQRLTRLPWIPIISMSLATPPGSPVAGDTYLIATSPTGSWSGQAGKIAEYTTAGWAIITPPNGHGVSLPDGRVFERVSGAYVEKIALDAQSSKWVYAADSGAANALVITLAPVPAAYVAGMALRVKAANANTGSATINVNGLGAKSILRRDGSALQKGDIFTGEFFDVTYDGAAFRLASMGQAEVQRSIPSATLYVRTDGNDNNDGSANTSGSALATIAAAIFKAQTQFNLAGRSLTIQLGNAGTYDTASLIGVAGNTEIRGDPAAETTYILTGTQGMSVAASAVKLTGLTINYQSGGSIGKNNLQVGGAGNVTLDKVSFGGTNQSTWAHILCSGAGFVNFVSAVTFRSDAHSAIQSTFGGNITISSTGSLVCSGSPAFASATAYAASCATITGAGTCSGAATGPRYVAGLNGVINVNGAGGNYFPGSTAGSVGTGGVYA